MLTEGMFKPLISSRLNVDKCTAYRELNRNSDQRNNVYRSQLALQKYNLRLENKAKLVKLQGALQTEVEEADIKRFKYRKDLRSSSK